MLYRTLLLLCFSQFMLFNIYAADSLTMTFCYEDKQLLPYYAGEGHTITSLPGVTIEHLLASAKSAGNIDLNFIRLPWQRCLQKLELNEVDALVATYLEKRSHFAVYPTTATGKPDPNRAMSSHASCLVHRPDNDIQAKLADPNSTLVVSRPLGYSNPDYPASVNVVQVHSQQQALELVVSGRVDATTTLCMVNGVAGAEPLLRHKPLVLVYPPLYETTGYLVFSKAFYQRHSAQAEQLWQLLGTTIQPQRYYDYLYYPNTPEQ